MSPTAALVAVLLATTVMPVRADSVADAKQAFGAFVASVSARKAVAPSLFITPGNEALPVGSMPDTAALIPKPQVTYHAVVVSPGDQSAWLAADLGAVIGKRKAKLRATAVLVKEAAGWRVTATHWGAEVKDTYPEMCGSMDGWLEGAHGAKANDPTVQAVIDGINDAGRKKLLPLLSEDKRALMIGSAPGEKFVGGAKIKSIYKKWNLAYMGDSHGESIEIDGNIIKGHDRFADSTPDGQLLWLAIPVGVHKFCTLYQGFLVLAKESGGWRVQLHHYSQDL